jgi:hypothetical protein
VVTGVTTPTERAHDRWSSAYLAAVIRVDDDAVIDLLTDLLADVKPSELWDLLDALGAAARDTILAVASAETACNALSARLVQDALLESAGQTDGHPG